MTMPNSVDKIFIIHYTKLTDRRAHMEAQMEQWFPNTPVEFVEAFDQEVVGQLDIIVGD